MKTTVVLAGAEWDAAVAGDDVYWSRAYVEAAAITERGTPALIKCGDALMALVLRDDGTAITPYGYGGPSGNAAPDFWSCYDAWCRRTGITSTFLRLHPLLPSPCDPSVAREPLFGTAMIPTTQGVDLFQAMHPKHRNKVRKALAHGLTVETQIAPADLREFSALYDRTMQRCGSTEFYRFPAAYWQALLRLTDRIALVNVRRGRDLVAATLGLIGPKWAHYHLSATTDEGRRSGAAQLALLALAEHSQSSGRSLVHLGGGLGGSDGSLLQFKRRFSPATPLLPYAVARMTHSSALSCAA